MKPPLFPLALAALCLAPALSPLAARPAVPLYCDMASYAPLELAWSLNSELRQVANVFPHPVLPRRALLPTGVGLYSTDDGGRTWNAIPQASADKVGAIQRVAFHPVEAGTFYLASRTKGIWVTSDGGKSFRQAGSATGGMAAD
ncbi:MAG: hypothetical protein PHQ12_15090, partial [Chthoniobacteraceae bacterium]|nr:hypothetical protein [Chthoniobacteraceae bacterium]